MIKDNKAALQDSQTPEEVSVPPGEASRFENGSLSVEEFSEIIPCGFAVFSIEAGYKMRTLYVSPRGSEIFGSTAQEYKENFQGEILPEWPFSLNGNSLSPTDLVDLLQGNTIEITVRSAKVDGQKIWLRAFCKMQPGEKAQTFYTTFMDVTGQIGFEERAQWQKERYQLLAQTIDGFVFDYDVEKERFTYSQRSARTGRMEDKVFNHGLNEIIGTSGWIQENSRETVGTEARRALEKSCEGSLEYQSKTFSGEIHWYSLRYVSVADDREQVFRIVGVVKDIQEQKELEQKNAARERSFRISMNADAVLSLAFDTKTGERIILPGDVCSPGIPENITLAGLFRIFMMLIHPDDIQAFREYEDIERMISLCAQSEGAVDTELRIRALKSPVDDYRWVKVSFMYTQDPSREDGDLFVLINDIHARKQLEIERLESASLDPLTGLYNRNVFREKSREILKKNTGRAFCMILIDLDSFKKYNENGVACGDKLLVKSARALRSVTRENELCSRFDSDAFSVLLECGSSCSDCRERVRTIRTVLSRKAGADMKLTASIGAVCITDKNADIDAMFEKAEQAMREAKRRGGNRFVYYTDEIGMRADETAAELSRTGTKPPASGNERKSEHNHSVVIRTFGYFDVFVDGKAVLFKNAKAKELLALLVDRRGGTLTSGEAISCLWENESSNRQTQSRYRKAAMHLKDTLESYDIADIIANNRGVRRAVPQNFECDQYDYIGGRESGNSAFHGSYLLNYSWGETTASALNETTVNKRTD